MASLGLQQPLKSHVQCQVKQGLHLGMAIIQSCKGTGTASTELMQHQHATPATYWTAMENAGQIPSLWQKLETETHSSISSWHTWEGWPHVQAALPCFQLVLVIKEHDIHPGNGAVLESREKSLCECCIWNIEGRKEQQENRRYPYAKQIPHNSHN